MTQGHTVEVNDRQYAFPSAPVVVVCIDGSEPDYHEQAMAAGRMPFTAAMLAAGRSLSADCAMPSFTNPNNLSIATGQPPAVHGICGNYFYDPDQGAEIMMNDPSFLRAPTIFAAFERAGARVAVITAKDKLRRLLGHDLSSSIRFSAERADAVTIEHNGIADVLDMVGRPLPEVYSADLSEFVMAAGVEVLERHRPDVMYLTLTDYVQHKYAPGTQEANDFYAMLDTYWAALDARGAVLVITSDHGMNAKSAPDGSPQVVYLQQALDERIGAGHARVVLPITDPYTAHHGSLGSFAFVHLDGVSGAAATEALTHLDGIDEIVLRDEAASRFELPADRIGDLAVIAAQDVALGTEVSRHDLSQLDRPLRSHGGLSEQRVPLFVNRPISGLPDGHRVRNYDAFWIGLNLVTSRVPREELTPRR